MFVGDSVWGIVCVGECLLLETVMEREGPDAATIRIITAIAELLSCLGGVECRSKRLFDL